jgi:hypothetical protein
VTFMNDLDRTDMAIGRAVRRVLKLILALAVVLSFGLFLFGFGGFIWDLVYHAPRWYAIAVLLMVVACVVAIVRDLRSV